MIILVHNLMITLAHNQIKVLSFLLILSTLYCFSLFNELISYGYILKYATFIKELLYIIGIFYEFIGFYDLFSYLFRYHGFGCNLTACIQMKHGYVARCFDIYCKLSFFCSSHLICQDQHSLIIVFLNQLVKILCFILLDIVQVSVVFFDLGQCNFFIFLFTGLYFCKVKDFSCLLLKID